MKLTSLFTLLALLTAPVTDHIATEEGPVEITPIHHSSMMLRWNSLTIYVDPHGDFKRYKGLHDPDIILVTDIHEDHLDLNTLAAINTKRSTLVAPAEVVKRLDPSGFGKVVELRNNEDTEVLGVSIKAMPMYNLPESGDSFHPKGRGNGYLLGLGDRNIYISGDTEDIPEMRALKDIDLAFVCMNLPYTMTVEQAVDAVLQFRPKVVYPYHYKGPEGKSDIEQFKRKVNKKDKGIEVRLRDWYRR